MGKTSILFNVTRNISALHTGSNLLYPCVCSESISLAVVLWNSAKTKPRQHNFVFPSVTSPFILGPSFSPTYLINSIKLEHSCKILFIFLNHSITLPAVSQMHCETTICYDVYMGESSKFSKSWTLEIKILKLAGWLQKQIISSLNDWLCFDNQKAKQKAIIVPLIQHFEVDFLWKVSLKVLNSGLILKTFTHVYGCIARVSITTQHVFNESLRFC